MRYICTKPYHDDSLFGEEKIILKVGEEVQTNEQFIISQNNHLICRIDSEVGHVYFARDDDGNGLERGLITYILAFETKFTDVQKQILIEKYPQFLRGIDVFLFNYDFFKAEIEDLRDMANDLGVYYELPVIFSNDSVTSIYDSDSDSDSDTSMINNVLTFTTQSEV